MADDEPKLRATDLPIAIYLNHRLTFDLLAALEGGFAHFTTVQIDSSERSKREVAGEASFDTNSLLSLFGIKLGGRASRQRDTDQTEKTTEEHIHTPVSLFARLRGELRARGLVEELTGCTHATDTAPGCFVEFEATLHRSGLVETLSSIDSIIQMAHAFGQDVRPPASNSGKRREHARTGKGSTDDLRKQIQLLIVAMTGPGSQDLLARTSDGSTLVITADTDHFIDKTMKDVLDGTFRVFGKVTRVVSDASGSINLLRSSPFGKIHSVNQAIINEIKRLPKVSDLGIGEVEMEVKGPTVQVVPVAIFS